MPLAGVVWNLKLSNWFRNWYSSKIKLPGFLQCKTLTKNVTAYEISWLKITGNHASARSMKSIQVANGADTRIKHYPGSLQSFIFVLGLSSLQLNNLKNLNWIITAGIFVDEPQLD